MLSLLPRQELYFPKQKHLGQVYNNEMLDCGRMYIIKYYVHSSRLSDAYVRLQNMHSLVQIMACRVFLTKPLSNPLPV